MTVRISLVVLLGLLPVSIGELSVVGFNVQVLMMSPPPLSIVLVPNGIPNK